MSKQRLDIHTPKGQESLRNEEKMLKYISNCWGVEIIQTNKNESAVCDGFLVKDCVIVALFESKCRKLLYEEMEEYGSWLITHEKIKQCRLLSEYLKVPFIGFLYLIKSNMVMFWKITDEDGKYNFTFETANTETKRTINDGITIRENAFLPFSNGEIVQERKI